MRMRLYAVSMLALFVAACIGLAPAPKAFSAGYQSIRMTDANQRPIALDLWFPADGVAEADFVALRNARNAQLEAPVLILPSLQVNIRAGALPPPEANGKTYLKLPVNAL